MFGALDNLNTDVMPEDISCLEVLLVNKRKEMRSQFSKNQTFLGNGFGFCIPLIIFSYSME